MRWEEGKKSLAEGHGGGGGLGYNGKKRLQGLKGGNVKRFEMMRVDLVAFWEYSAAFDDSCCAICRNQLKEPCIECQALNLTGKIGLTK